MGNANAIVHNSFFIIHPSKSYAEKLRLLIRDDSVLPHSEYLANLTAKQPDAKGTTHVSVVDTNELYVSITS